MTVEIRVPEQYMGEVNRDLNGKRGRVLGMDTDGGDQIITRARAPGGAVLLRDRAAIAGPAAAARSRPSSTTTRTCPAHVAEKVIEEHRKAGDGSGGHGAR